jgi:hypothetical protein
LPATLGVLRRCLVLLRGYDMLGLAALRAMPPATASTANVAGVQPLQVVVGEFARRACW